MGLEVGVADGVGVGLDVGAGVDVGVAVGVGLGVLVGVGVDDGVGVGVGVGVGDGEGLGLGLIVIETEPVIEEVTESVAVTVRTPLAVSAMLKTPVPLVKGESAGRVPAELEVK